MKLRAILALILALSLLTGCSWMDTGYVSVTPHQEHAEHIRDGMVSASNYGELRTALEAMVNAGQESCVINISDYKSSAVESGMSMAARYIQTSYPIGAYAVTELHYEVGSNSGKPQMAAVMQEIRVHCQNGIKGFRIASFPEQGLQHVLAGSSFVSIKF